MMDNRLSKKLGFVSISGHWRRITLLFSRSPPSTTTEVATSSPTTAATTKRWTPMRSRNNFLREETEQRKITFFCHVEQRQQLKLTAISENKTFFFYRGRLLSIFSSALCYSHLLQSSRDLTNLL